MVSRTQQMRFTPDAAMRQECEGVIIKSTAHAKAIESIEVNPLRALPKGAIGLDALIVKRSDNT